MTEAAAYGREVVRRDLLLEDSRTPLRLERTIWNALEEIGKRESCPPSDICALVAEAKMPFMPLAVSLRVFVLAYCQAAVEAGAA